MEAAKRLIAGRSVPLISVAAMCGYEDYPFFARVFRRRTGMSMRDWSARMV